MSKARIWQYAILWHPTEKQVEDGKKSELIKDPTTVVANDEKSVAMIAAREVPEEYLTDLDRVEVVCRPF